MRYAALYTFGAQTSKWTPRFIACFILGACAPAISAGCLTYEAQRSPMPPLGTDAVSEWVAVTDTALTEACR